MKYRKTALIEAEQYREGLEDGIDENGPYLNTLEGKMIYDQANVAQVFKTSPDKRGRLYLGTKNKVIVIELKDSI